MRSSRLTGRSGPTCCCTPRAGPQPTSSTAHLRRPAAYGMAATGKGKSSAGSQALAKAIERDDPRPLWICLWGGVNTLAQALIDLRAAHTPAEMDRLIAACASPPSPTRTTPARGFAASFQPLLCRQAQPAERRRVLLRHLDRHQRRPYYRNGAGADTSLSPTSGWKPTSAPRAHGQVVSRASCSSWKATRRRTSASSTTA
jgi:hypothetical protein